MSHLQYTANCHHLQYKVKQLSKICHWFYHNYCPKAIKQRHNVKLARCSDESILILLVLQAELGIKSQRHFYKMGHLFCLGKRLERSRFNRWSKNLI